MLEIRRASAQLHNLGSFRMPELDNGSARAFAAQADAAKSAAAAARVAGQATVEGISRRGQIVARTLGDLGRMAVDFANRENERIATNAVLQSENDRNLYMTGDGTPENPGQLNIRQGKDGEWHAEEWLNGIKKAAEARRERFTKDLNGPQRRIYDEMVAKRDVAWNARIFAHAAKTTLDAEIATATAALAQAKEKAIGDFDVPSARESSIQEMYEAKERELNVRQVPESLRAAEMKALTEDFLVNFAKTKFTAWENETFDSADPDAVAKTWKDKGDALQGLKGKVIDSEAVRKHLGGDRLDKARQEMLTRDFNTHRSAAIGRAYSLQRENERKELDAIGQASRGAIASGDLAEIETALGEMRSKATALGGVEKTKGSRVHVAALEEAARLDKAADSLVQYQLMNDLANDEKQVREDVLFEDDPRRDRLFPKVYAAFQEQRRKEFDKGFRAARDRNLLAMDYAMMKYAADGNPHGFFGYLSQAVVDRKITTGDFARLRDKFTDGWMKGFKGDPNRMAKQTETAKTMLDAIKTKLGVDLSTAIKTDDYGDPAIKNGALDWDDKALEKGDVELPDASVRRQFKKVARRGDMFFSFGSDTGMRKEKIEGQQLRKALDAAMALWSSDGMQIEMDPVTGESLTKDPVTGAYLTNSKPHTVNAVADFNALLDRLVDERNVLSAADTLKQQAAYVTNVRSNAVTVEKRRAKERANPNAVTDEQVEKKDDKGE